MARQVGRKAGILEEVVAAKIFENYCGIFVFLCYIPALSKELEAFPMSKNRPKIWFNRAI
jgi:hypothetical protein